MITIKRRTIPNERATWAPLRDGDKLSASLICPNGHYGVLLDHEISNDGTVSPSVECSEEGCNFHEYIKLEDWKP